MPHFEEKKDINYVCNYFMHGSTFGLSFPSLYSCVFGWFFFLRCGDSYVELACWDSLLVCLGGRGEFLALKVLRI
jgi:hypothetical protein